MRRVALLAVIVALSAGTARADWTKGGSSNSSTYYVDRTTIVRNGGSAFMWNLTDYDAPQSWQNQAFLSSSAKFEYDCSGRRSRVMVEQGFSGHMGRGQKTYTVQGPRPWLPIEPNTRGEEKLAIACGR